MRNCCGSAIHGRWPKSNAPLPTWPKPAAVMTWIYLRTHARFLSTPRKPMIATHDTEPVQRISSAPSGAEGLTTLAGLGLAPKALLFSGHIDSVTASGVLMADIFQEKRIITVDLLGDEFLEAVSTGAPISIHEDGTVEVG